MQRYIFLDLDDTLFQTLRKCEFGGDDPRLQVRAYLPDGTPNSFATHKQQWLWDWLSQGFKIVPVTARDVHAFNRCNLPFQEEIILNHGAVILNKQRKVDPVWMEKMLSALPYYQDKLFELWQDIECYVAQYQGYRLNIVNDFDVTWYGYVKHKDKTESILSKLLDAVIKPHPAIVDGSLYWHLNGNNLAVLPKLVSKESAVGYLLTNYKMQYQDLLTFGSGDSKTDAAFISLCDYALIPKRTQLFQSLFNLE